MPRSKKVESDTEEAEIYSVSMTHQLHCLVKAAFSVFYIPLLISETGSIARCYNQILERR